MIDYAAIPNRLILDPSLRPTTRRVAFALYAYRNRSNTICRSIKALAKMCHCCRNTVIQALKELEAHHYLKRKHRRHYSAALRRTVYKANQYILRVDMSRGYTLIPRCVLRADITHTQFAVYLLLFAKQGRSSHSYPSLRRIAAALWIAKSTVCLAVHVLVCGQYIARNHCRNVLGSYSCNCYYVIVVVQRTGPKGTLEPLDISYHTAGDSARSGGGPIFDTVKSINNIT